MTQRICVLWLGAVLAFGQNAVSADNANQPQITPEVALKRLQEGNARFVADQLLPREPYYVQRARLANGQRPFAVILTCADSRLTPELIFNQQLGDIFVIRVAGNVTSPELIGSIEYAVENLGPTLVVVLGHTKCGAVEAALAGGRLQGNVADVVKRVYVGTGLPNDKDAALVAATRNNVARQTQELVQKSTVLKDYASSGRIRILGGVYSLQTGMIDWMGPEKNQNHQEQK